MSAFDHSATPPYVKYLVQLLWYSDHFHNQRSTVRIQSIAIILVEKGIAYLF